MYQKEIVATMINMASTEEGRNLIKSFSDSFDKNSFQTIAKIRGIPEHLAEDYALIMKGDMSPLKEKIEKIDKWFNTGDIFLTAGISIKSEILVNIQKKSYKHARSSHVSITMSDFMCIDATPASGVSIKLVSDVLSEIKDNWRIIRLKNLLSDKDEEKLRRACVYYFSQPYRIVPSTKSAKKHSYCSELARKIYVDSEIKDTGIPNSKLIKPCDFDYLADKGEKWSDVTEELKPAIKFCIEYQPILNLFFIHFRNGLLLNRDRFKERKEDRVKVRKLMKKGIIPKETGQGIIAELNKADRAMNNQFWDFSNETIGK